VTFPAGGMEGFRRAVIENRGYNTAVMGITYVEGLVGPASGRVGEAKIRFLVDTRAFYTVVPADVARNAGIKPARTERVRFADGRTARWRIGEARLRVNGRSTATWVLFGRPGTQPLLGAYTLEGMGLVVNSRTRKLSPSPEVIVAGI